MFLNIIRTKALSPKICIVRYIHLILNMLHIVNIECEKYLLYYNFYFGF